MPEILYSRRRGPTSHRHIRDMRPAYLLTSSRNTIAGACVVVGHIILCSCRSKCTCSAYELTRRFDTQSRCSIRDGDVALSHVPPEPGLSSIAAAANAIENSIFHFCTPSSQFSARMLGRSDTSRLHDPYTPCNLVRTASQFCKHL